jgi:hypothetical protein
VGVSRFGGGRTGSGFKSAAGLGVGGGEQGREKAPLGGGQFSLAGVARFHCRRRVVFFFFWLRGEAGKGDDEASAAETIDAGSRGFFPDGGAHAVT